MMVIWGGLVTLAERAEAACAVAVRRAKLPIREVEDMAGKEILDKLSIYIPQKKMDANPVERLIKLGKKRDRSVNYLVVEAIIQYLDREEKVA